MSAFETDAEHSRASTIGVSNQLTPIPDQQQMWRTAAPNQHVDEQTKRNYVLEVSRRLNLTRREMANAANIQEFRYMNYWIRGKDITKDEVKKTGAILYNWAVSTDSRVAVPMSREEEEILRTYQLEKQRAQEEAEREKQQKLLRTQQARAKMQKEKQALETKLKKEREAAAAAAAAAAAPATTTAQVTTKKRIKLESAAKLEEEEEWPKSPPAAIAASASWESPRPTGKLPDSPPLRSHRRDSLFYNNPHLQHLSAGGSLLGSSPMVSRSSFEDTPTRMGSNSTFPNESPLSLETPRRHTSAVSFLEQQPQQQQQQQQQLQQLGNSATRPMGATPLSLSATPLRLQEDNHHQQRLLNPHSVLLNNIPDVFQGHDMPDATPPQILQQQPSTSAAPPRRSARKLDF